MSDIDPTKRERAEDHNTLRPFWRLPVIVIGAAIGMALWLVLAHIIPK